MTKELNYSTIDRPYDNDAQRVVVYDEETDKKGSDNSSENVNISKETTNNTSPGTTTRVVVIDKSSFDNTYISTWIKSVGYKPKKQGFLIDGSNGYIECMKLFVGGGGIEGGELHIPNRTSDSSFHVNSFGDLWLGSKTFNITTNPFAVSRTGQLRAISGNIGGWELSSGSLSSDSIIIDSVNNLIKIGEDDDIIIDGDEKSIKSSNYSSGINGTGFYLDPNLLEVGNARVRGVIKTAVFEKDVVHVMGGNFAVLDGDVLSDDMTALDNSTLTIEGNSTFAVGDILRIKDGLDDEWMTVSSISSAPTYVVSRDRAGMYSSNDNPVWKKGATVTNYKQSGNGGVYMTASDSNAPYLNIFDHSGTPWTGINERLRLGNLNGFLGYTSNLYGIAIGDSNAYLKYDKDNGIRIKGSLTMTAGSVPNENVTGLADIVADLQSQIDGQILSWFYDYVPTLLNLPASDWTTDEIKNDHLGDLFYDTSTGYAYRFAYTEGVYQWMEITDTDVVKALAMVTAAQLQPKGFFQDSKPISGMTFGDIWIDTDGHNPLTVNDIYRYEDINGQSLESMDWRLATNNAFGLVYLNAYSAQNTANSRVRTFFQGTIPTSTSVGDIWINTSQNNEMYRAASIGADEIVSGEWESARDLNIAQALQDASDAMSAASGAQATADGKVTTFFQNEPPVAEGLGDLWIDTNDGNKLYRWNESEWIEIQDKGISQAISDAADAQSTADGKIVSYYQAIAPTIGLTTGDLWIDTSDDNKLYRWSGTQWISARDVGIAQALQDASDAMSAASGAQATADGKVTTFFQNEPPTAEGLGDLWIDTNDGNKLYRWNNTEWIKVQDQAIQDAISAAADAQSTADGKIVSYYQPEEPIENLTIGDFWIDTDDFNKLYRFNGTAWVQVQLYNEIANQALADAATAISNAATAQATADGKVTTFFQDEPPTAEGLGDLWIDTDDGNKLYRWNNAEWIEVQDEGIQDAISAASDAQSTADGKIVSFYQPEPPIASALGDFWIDTNDNNKLYRWSGEAWILIYLDNDVANQALQDAATAISDAAGAQGTADGKVTTYYQANIPISTAIGDLWIDTDDGNKLYRAAKIGANKIDDGEWKEVQDEAIQDAISAAADAQSTADGKIVTFYQNEAPTASAIGDLWVDTNDGNKLHRWSGIEWVSIRDTGIAEAIQDAADAQSTADGKIITFAQAEIPTSEGIGDLWIDINDKNKLYRAAIAGADQITKGEWELFRDEAIADAQATADGKIVSFFQDEVPTSEGIGDLWFDTDDNNKCYRAAIAGADQVTEGEWEETPDNNKLGGTESSAVGGSYATTTSGARLLMFPSSDIALQIIDDGSNDVFKAYVGGTNIGDVIFGGYPYGGGFLYDKSENKTYFNGILEAVTGSLGSLTIDEDGDIKSGQTAYNTGIGFWLGDDSGTTKFSLGNPSGNYITWDGSEIDTTGLNINTRMIAGENLSSGNIVCIKPSYTDYTATQTAYVDGNSGYANLNFYSDDYIYMGSGGLRLGYIEFGSSVINFIPAGEFILKAELILTSREAISSNHLSIQEVLSATWNETTITYNNDPTSSSANIGTPITTIGAASAGLETIIDITQLVRQWKEGAITNRGFRMSVDGDAKYYGNRSTIASFKPKLRVYASYKTDGKAYKADGDDYLLSRSIVGVALETKSSTESTKVQIGGVVTNITTTNPGGKIYLSTIGRVVESSSGLSNIIPLGDIINNNKIIWQKENRGKLIEEISTTILMTSGTKTLYIPDDCMEVKLYMTDYTISPTKYYEERIKKGDRVFSYNLNSLLQVIWGSTNKTITITISGSSSIVINNIKFYT